MIVDPKRSFRMRTSLISRRAKETDRRAPTADSKTSGAQPGMETGPVASSIARRASRTAVRPTSRAARMTRSGLLTMLGRAWVTRRVCEGSRAGIHGGQGSVTALPSGVRSSSWASSCAPATPSMTEWWTLAISPTMPSASPSITCISHGGWSGWSGRPMTSATISVNSASPPGAGSAARCRWLARSNSGSSTQQGWSRPSGTAMRRRRNGASVGSLASSSSEMRSNAYPPSAVAGSKTHA